MTYKEIPNFDASNWQGKAILIQCVETGKYFVLSGIRNMWRHEVMAFAADENGHVESFAEWACWGGTSNVYYALETLNDGSYTLNDPDVD